MKYKIYYQTVTGYWLSKRRKSIVIEASSELNAEIQALELLGEIVDITIRRVKP